MIKTSLHSKAEAADVEVTFNGYSDFRRRVDFNVSKDDAPLTGISCSSRIFKNANNAQDFESQLKNIWDGIEGAVASRLDNDTLKIDDLFSYTVIVPTSAPVQVVKTGKDQ